MANGWSEPGWPTASVARILTGCSPEYKIKELVKDKLFINQLVHGGTNEMPLKG